MKRFNIKWKLVAYDMLVFILVTLFLGFTSYEVGIAATSAVIAQVLITGACTVRVSGS